MGPPIRSNVYKSPFDWTSTEWLVTTNSERRGLNYPSSFDEIKSTRQYIETTNLSKHTILIKQMDYNECVTLGLVTPIDQRAGLVALIFNYDSKK